MKTVELSEGRLLNLDTIEYLSLPLFPGGEPTFAWIMPCEAGMGVEDYELFKTLVGNRFIELRLPYEAQSLGISKAFITDADNIVCINVEKISSLAKTKDRVAIVMVSGEWFYARLSDYEKIADQMKEHSNG